ncbi:type IV toxin-antitoxin system AbiEi family antitoxin domain-containing protein [Nocardia wallacei]|uniref:type IV toxin-antitoxin system AbiEi family antitoxin domain-containing protein n=1 Tax=Nocardia wallacei TaxID=480035 RepID=UPI002455B5E6|nr:type IV toxin-antitoxin system AbiEi family antitoxin domain-containing protein [Nocardia wallacei]
MRSDERLLELADLAEEQWGLITSAQASNLGVTAQRLKRLADNDLLVRIRHGVYRLAGSPESPQELIRAEWLALEPKRLAGERIHDAQPSGVVSHRSAARLLGLGDLDADVNEFTVPRRRGTRSLDVRCRIAPLEREEWYLVDGLPVTRPLRTITDLAAGHTDGGHLASVVRDAILAGETSREEIAKSLRPYTHYYGVPIGAGDKLVDMFIEQAGVPESAVALSEATTRFRKNVDELLRLTGEDGPSRGLLESGPAGNFLPSRLQLASFATGGAPYDGVLRSLNNALFPNNENLLKALTGLYPNVNENLFQAITGTYPAGFNVLRDDRNSSSLTAIGANAGRRRAEEKAAEEDEPEASSNIDEDCDEEDM